MGTCPLVSAPTRSYPLLPASNFPISTPPVVDRKLIVWRHKSDWAWVCTRVFLSASTLIHNHHAMPRAKQHRTLMASSYTAGITKNSKIRFVGSKTKRSIVSCNECRRRKKRCDEKRPHCSACIKRKVSCEYQRGMHDEFNMDETQKDKGKETVVHEKIDMVNHNIEQIIDKDEVEEPEDEEEDEETDGDTPIIKIHNNNGNIPSTDSIEGIETIEELDNQMMLISKGNDNNNTSTSNDNNNTNISPGWSKFSIFSPDDTTSEFQPLDSINNNFFVSSTTMLTNTNANNNTTTSNPSPEFIFNMDMNNINNIIDMNLNINTMNLELDLEFVARSILDTFNNNDELKKTLFPCKSKDKFLKSFSLLMPLTYNSRAILLVLTAWVLSISGDIRSSKYIDESMKIVDKLEFKIDYSGEWNEDDLIDYIVSLTGLTLISSINGDTALWKASFERLYTGLKKIGLDMLSLMIKKKENKTVLYWVVNWFFYQDIFKMIKVTSNRLLGPLFSKKEYLKFIGPNSTNNNNIIINDEKNNDRHESNSSSTASEPVDTDSTSVSPPPPPPQQQQQQQQQQHIRDTEAILKRCFDTSISCCMNLYVVLGEINAMYDQFIIKIQEPIIPYYKYILPIMDSLDEEAQIKFVNSETYLNYELIRFNFHSWVQEKTTLLEKRIQECTIFNNGIGPIPEDTVLYFNNMKLAIMLYMKFKVRELSATSYEIKQIVLGIFENMRILLKMEKYNNQLLFPLLMIGANVCEHRDRMMIKGFYLKMMETNSNKKNLEQVFTIVQEFWRLNPNGVSFEMWQNILNKYDWNVCIV